MTWNRGGRGYRHRGSFSAPVFRRNAYYESGGSMGEIKIGGVLLIVVIGVGIYMLMR